MGVEARLQKYVLGSTTISSSSATEMYGHLEMHILGSPRSANIEICQTVKSLSDKIFKNSSTDFQALVRVLGGFAGEDRLW